MSTACCNLKMTLSGHRSVITPSLTLLQVANHLTKLFDSMAKLKFEQDEAGNTLKNATAMWAADGEYVDFNSPCDCNGQVRNN